MRYISLAALSIGMMTVCEVQASTVKDVQINGLERVEPETVQAYLEIEKGQDVSQFDIDAALKRLYATGLFSDISLDLLGNGVLVVKATENPIVNKRYFEGNDEIEDSMLERELQLNPGSIYSVAKVQQDIPQRLQRRMVVVGYGCDVGWKRGSTRRSRVRAGISKQRQRRKQCHAKQCQRRIVDDHSQTRRTN